MKFTIVLPLNVSILPIGIINNTDIINIIKYPFINETIPPSILEGIINTIVAFTIFWTILDIFNVNVYIPNNKLNIIKNAINWYNIIFSEDIPSIAPLNLKNGRYIHKKFPIIPFNCHDNTNTTIIPTNDTNSFITPLLLILILNLYQIYLA